MSAGVPGPPPGPVWPEGFDPENLTRDASLNKQVVGPAPGAHPGHVGQNGGDLLSRDAVVRLVQRRCGVVVPPDAVADWLAAAIAAHPAGGAAAVADEVGDRLASLVATLRDPATAALATGGRRAYLDVWPRLAVVTLAGGLMKGAVGVRVAARAGAVLGAGGVDPPVVRVAPRPEWVALLGAARSTTGSDGRAVVLDGGGSSIKRGVALIRDQQLAGVHALPPLAVTSIPPSDPSAAVGPTVAALVEEGVTEVVFSVASYVRDGRPIAYRSSIYEQLDLASMRLRLGVPVRVIHDGTAAWRGTGTGADAPSAVITLGTWLGVGIGPQREVLRPYAEDFVLQTDAVPA